MRVVFFNRVETHHAMSMLAFSLHCCVGLMRAVVDFLLGMLVHCWVSGVLSPGCNPLGLSAGRVLLLCGGGVGGGWFEGVLCENCIVDASICRSSVCSLLWCV